MPSIPQELTYAPDPDTVQNVVLSRSEVYLQSPEPEFSPTGASRITFAINTSNFVDLSSVAMYAKLSTHVIGAADPSITTTGTAGATKLHLNSTMSLFQDITISSGTGTIIEQLSNAHILGAVLADTGLSQDYCDTVGSFSNAQCDPNDRDACIDGTESYHILALKMSGFLTGSHKYLRPSSLGGIHIACTLAPNTELMVVRNAADNATFKMTETRLFYDEVTVDPSYQRYYTEQYENLGMQIMFPSYGSQLGQITSNGDETVPFSASAQRCQALMAAVRVKANGNNKLASGTGFVAPGAGFSYTWELGGARLPPAGISSYSRAFDQILKISGAKHNAQHSLFKLSDFNSDYSVANRTGGKFVAAVDCERLESSSQTGVRLSPGSNNLLLRYPGLQNVAHDVFIFWMYDRALSVVQGQSTVTY